MNEDGPTKVGTCWTEEAMLIRLSYHPSLLSNRILIIKPPFSSSLFSKGIRVRPVTENPDTTFGAPGSTRSRVWRDRRLRFLSGWNEVGKFGRLMGILISNWCSLTTGHLFVSSVILTFCFQTRGKIPEIIRFSALTLYHFQVFLFESKVSNQHQFTTEGSSHELSRPKPYSLFN